MTSAGPEGRRYAQVALADGFALWGVLDDDQAVAAGSPVVACLRKEHIGVRRADGQPSLAPSATCPEEQTFAGLARAASFLGLDEEYMIVIAGLELRAVRPASGVVSGDAVDVTIRPQDCMIFRATAGRLDE